MALPTLAASAVSRAATAQELPKQNFSKLVAEGGALRSPSPARALPPSTSVPSASASAAQGARRCGVPSSVGKSPRAAQVIDEVNRAQARLDRVLKIAQSGRCFTPAELLGLQAQVSQASQQLDLAGKVVEKATSGVKQVLQTQV